MKKVLVSLIAAVVCLSLLTTSIWAGSKQRRRWEGVAIGVGAAILGHAILKDYRHHHTNEKIGVDRHRGTYYAPPPPQRHRRVDCPPRPSRRGHWEIRKVWAPPTYKKVRNPGHYNHRREWVPAKWIKIIEQEGHWIEKEVWVGRR
ncbi:MAG: hypothetical protein DRI57_19285 [Deltaproteobacteria bacterium]|nr:MAG: hypothetical protein DRI57_19285 [Deltaproteobacteria bacterium]